MNKNFNTNSINSTKVSNQPKASTKRLYESKRELRDTEALLADTKQSIARLEEELVYASDVTYNTVVGPFTIVELTLNTEDNRVFTGEGIAKKSEYDNSNEELGYCIAYGRAKKSLLRKINGDIASRELFVG